MKKFDPIGTIKKCFIPIMILTILGTCLVYFYITKKQTYSASILIEYTGSKAEQGLNPDDTPIDISELYSATIIDDVIKSKNLSCSVEEIRSSIEVVPVIPSEETAKQTAAIEMNEEYSFIPTKFVVTYTADNTHSQEYARDVLDSILNKYYTFYSEKYIENVAYPNNSANISIENYDYIECAEMLRSNVNSIATFCMARDASFYSAKSGYSFYDLQLEFEYWRDNLLYDYNTYVLDNKITVDRSLLLQKEQNNIAQFNIKIADTTDYIERQKEVISQFAEKTLDGQAGMGNLEEAGIVTDVEEDYGSYNIDTTYDILINHYAKLLLDLNFYESEKSQAERVIEIFSTAEEETPSNATRLVANKKLAKIVESFNELYEHFVVTVKDYYNVRSADYLSFNSNIVTDHGLSIKLYLVLAMFMFFVLSSCGAIFIVRVMEIAEGLNNENDTHTGRYEVKKQKRKEDDSDEVNEIDKVIV